MLNRVILRGYVADMPFIRSTENGKLARIRMVTIEHIEVHKTGRIRPHTEWHTISLWGNNADVADNLIKVGSAIEIEGALRTREWTDREGIVRKTTEISASKLELLKTIEGYEIPSYIASLIPKESPKSECKLEVKRPADDPDDLPF